MKLQPFTEVYAYRLNLNLLLLKEYHIDAQLMHDWSENNLQIDVMNYGFSVTYALNQIKNIDDEVEIIINSAKFNKQVNIDELRNSLMFFCFELEKQLLATVYNDEDYLQLVKIAQKIIQINDKPLKAVNVNRINLNDESIASEVLELSTKRLCEKFIRCARYTKFREISTLNEIIEFENQFKEASEAHHLAILGDWAQLIQTYLHNEQLLLSVDSTKLNIKYNKDFPLTVQQSDFIYSLFFLFNFLTPRKKNGLDANAYIRNCISKFEMANAGN